MLHLDDLKKTDFFYELPEELIAQTPIEPRSASRLLAMDRESGAITHSRFYNLCGFLRKGDLLVLNDSRVLPARIYGVRADTGSFIEFLLLEQKSHMVWEIICRPGKKAKVGVVFTFGDGKLTAEVLEVRSDGNRVVRFSCEGNFFAVLDEIGQMPLPPYITEKLADKERYQTVYSRETGSAAAPTAGLHFTDALLDEIRAHGVKIAFVTLHVGLGTFRPVKEEAVTAHKMHSEHYTLPAETAALINETRRAGGRVVAVGTTSCRTLETAARRMENGMVTPCDGFTDIFIYPGYTFKLVDAMITNFHLPESTLIMLVSAFAGYENTMNAYRAAVEKRYRFFSFGDAMFMGSRMDDEKSKL
ncbi:MAG: tRNA preQ1(34) S-adenosylmethionine ribosyltransferase-isomerase QueA [Oscillospiraceae bacterium]